MSHDPTIPDAVRRFVLTSVPSVPFLEAARAFHSNAGSTIAPSDLALVLYVTGDAAEGLVSGLVERGIVAPVDNGYRFAPRDAPLAAVLDELFKCYSVNLVGITKLIHDATQRSAERFANAFKLRKEP
jgi:hypothetical protein